MTRVFGQKSNFWVRVSCAFFFIMEGLYNGVLSSYLPQIQNRLEVSDSIFGLAMLLLYLGQVFATPFAGATMRKSGSKISTFTGAFGFALSIPFVAMRTSYTAFCFVILFYGFMQGWMDCSMNASAILAEIVAQYPILGSFHGSYSVAAAIGAFSGNAMYAAQWSDLKVCTALTCTCGVLVLLAGNTLYDMKEEKAILNMVTLEQEAQAHAEANALAVDRTKNDAYNTDDAKYSMNNAQATTPTRSTDKDAIVRNFTGYDQSFQASSMGTRGSADNLPLLDLVKKNDIGSKCSWLNQIFMIPQTLPLMYLSMLGFLAAFAETAIGTWLIIFYARYFPAAPQNAATLGFVCFEVCMGCGRFMVDKLRRWLGSRNMAKIGGALATIGFTLLSVSPDLTPASGSTATSRDIIVASFGMCLCGLGLSTLIPLTFACAGYIEHSGTSIATVGCWMYAGGIISNPVLGGISTAFNSLRMAMAFLAGFSFLILPLGFFIPLDRYKERDDSPRERTGVSADEDLHAPLIV